MKKVAIVTMILAMVLAVGLPVLQAQDNTPAPQTTPNCPYWGKTPPCGAGMGMGRGMGYHGGRGMGRGMGRGLNPNCPYANTATGAKTTPPAPTTGQ